MVDTHAHLVLCEPAEAELVAAAREAGVRRMLTVGLDEDTNRAAIAAAEAHEEVFASVGRHPNSAAGFDDAAADRSPSSPPTRGCGRSARPGSTTTATGAPRDEQRRAFEAQIEIAARRGTCRS